MVLVAIGFVCATIVLVYLLTVSCHTCRGNLYIRLVPTFDVKNGVGISSNVMRCSIQIAEFYLSHNDVTSIDVNKCCGNLLASDLKKIELFVPPVLLQHPADFSLDGGEGGVGSVEVTDSSSSTPGLNSELTRVPLAALVLPQPPSQSNVENVRTLPCLAHTAA